MILFVFICKRFFQLITFIYKTKLKGHDGIAVYKPLHFSPDFTGNIPKIRDACWWLSWAFFRERIKRMFLVEIFYDAAIKVCFGVSIVDQHAFHVHEFLCLLAIL